MRTTLFGMILTGLVGASLAVSPPRANSAEPTHATLPTMTVNADQGLPAQSAAYGWRYRWYGGRWWYWTPQNNWVYWYGDAWVPYAPGVTAYSYGYNPYPYRYYTGYRGVYPGYGAYYGPSYYNYYGPRRYYGYFGRRPYRWWY